MFHFTTFSTLGLLYRIENYSSFNPTPEDPKIGNPMPNPG